MLISSKEKIVEILYPKEIRKQIRIELIEQMILEAQELCMMCWLVEDMESLEFFYQSKLNWQQILSDIKKIDIAK